MINLIGELLYQKGKPLVKMWESNVPSQSRTFIKHYHSYFEITLVLSGSGNYSTENETYPIHPGDVFVFSSNEVHYITEIEEDISLINLHFAPRFLGDDESPLSADSFLTFCFSHSPEFKNRIPAAYASSLRHRLVDIKHEFEQNDTYKEISIRSHLYLALIDLLRNHNYHSSPIQPNSVSSMLAVYDYIDSHLSDELTLEAISKIAMLSPNYFSHFFKHMNGISLWDYINAKRIEKAEKLITSKKEKYTMLQIATMCGFNNTVNFNKTFKKQKGITPSELRKMPRQP